MQSGAGVVHCQDWFQFSLHSPSLLLIKQNKKIIQLLWLKHKYSSLEELWHKNICPNLANSDEVPINCFLSCPPISTAMTQKISFFYTYNLSVYFWLHNKPLKAETPLKGIQEAPGYRHSQDNAHPHFSRFPSVTHRKYWNSTLKCYDHSFLSLSCSP